MTQQVVSGWRWWLWPLRSRKVQVAIATIAAAWLAHGGMEVSESVLTAIVATGVALILGIAHEDNGKAQ